LKVAKPIAHGIDIVELSDFYKLVEKLAFNHMHIYFTNNEIVTAGNGVNRNEKLASRFAIKEAVLKFLGKGWGMVLHLLMWSGFTVFRRPFD